MIKKLQRRFIRIAVIALAIAMVVVVGIVNIVNWVGVRSELQGTLRFLAENEAADLWGGIGSRMMGKTKHVRNVVSESNWFGVRVMPNGGFFFTAMEDEADPDEQTALALAKQALDSGKESGFLQDYLYSVTTFTNGDMSMSSIVFLNCETTFTAERTLALISLVACLGGVALAWLIMALASRRAVRPILRNMEQQKQFITDASHELKTPLTVISTNMDLLQMENPGNQWVRSTQKQASQMRRLVDELVYLSRMEEESAPLVMESLAFNALLEDTAEPFVAMAEFQGHEMTVRAEDNLTVFGDRASIQRLISTLCDNAVKYAAGESAIRIEAHEEGRFVTLHVSNETNGALSKEQCEQLFNRFYRADASRNKEKQSGFGIGLAIAAAIAEKHGGSISAAMEQENRITFTCRLPKSGK
ncbi:MAG: HAMP domain-containing histidine kinase [Clostridia bacterium]|nr:HAMP domain-containing histidine kinase [Clostridia bacterium]